MEAGGLEGYSRPAGLAGFDDGEVVVWGSSHRSSREDGLSTFGAAMQRSIEFRDGTLKQTHRLDRLVAILSYRDDRKELDSLTTNIVVKTIRDTNISVSFAHSYYGLDLAESPSR